MVGVSMCVVGVSMCVCAYVCGYMEGSGCGGDWLIGFKLTYVII